MNRMIMLGDIDPLQNPLDALLADIAVNVQLPPGLHEKATDRYEAVRKYVERPGSPLADRVVRFYPQGSMAIDATISTRGTDTEYDIDIVAEIEGCLDEAPGDILDLLAEALEGYGTDAPIKRQTRCVTVPYADGMHLDLTPAGRRLHWPERESLIFHANPDRPLSEHYPVPMNAYGFAGWYRGRTPLERRFALAMTRRLYEAHGYRFRAEAEVDEVPDQVSLIVKNTATAALQLLKRFRNVAYANAMGRIPPSVMLSCFAGHVASPNTTLSEMLIRLARHIARAIWAASARRERIRVVNPVFEHDEFTDRWPENLAQQDEFAQNLTDLADGLAHFRSHEVSIEELQEWLRDRFGSRVVSRSVKQLNERIGHAVRGAGQTYTPKGGLFVPSAPRIIGAAAPLAAAPAVARPHTFMGGRRT
jgi:hypothetical protein